MILNSILGDLNRSVVNWDIYGSILSNNKSYITSKLDFFLYLAISYTVIEDYKKK